MPSEEQAIHEQEEQYLKRTLDFLSLLLQQEESGVEAKKEELVAYHRDMYENITHHSQDMSRLSEAAQYLIPLEMQNIDYKASQQRVNLYRKMEDSPYFARVDFETEQWGRETIYIGIGTLEDEEGGDIFVYDWRAPISSIFYRFELGPAQYQAPAGSIEGEVELKRQYEIQSGVLQYYFDSSVNIIDDVLKEALSHNTSPQMRTIVETIQREQDLVIRDQENDVVIVQGVAGSGKTSIALHRAAFLMYQGLGSHLAAKNMILISPNRIFEQYISDVLPELGEENIQSTTFESIFRRMMGDQYKIRSRNQALEEVLSKKNEREQQLLRQVFTFKSSPVFMKLLHQLVEYVQRRMITFCDLMYDGQIIAQRELMKSRFLNSRSRSLPLQVRLNHIEDGVKDTLKQMRAARLRKLEHILDSNQSHSYDYKAAARLINARQTSNIMKELRKSTQLNYLEIYREMFREDSTFYTHAKELEDFEKIAAYTRTRLQTDTLDYADAMALLYLRLCMDSGYAVSDIRQVVVDEAQDYSPLHFEILNHLFPGAKYTILGDLNQSIVQTGETDFYETVQKVLGRKKNAQVFLHRSFRCSWEITEFSAKFAQEAIEIERLDRHSNPPKLVEKPTEKELLKELTDQIREWKDAGLGTIGIVCKNMAESKQLANSLKGIGALPSEEPGSVLPDVVILPIYLAKGLEFDGVAVWNVSSANYHSEDDKRLLYIASTRALHQLSLFYSGEISPLIQK